MTTDTQPDFTYLRQEIDLSLLASSYTALSAIRPDEYRGRCPIHGGKSKSFRVWCDSNREWHYCCYSGCGRKGGDAVTLLQALEGYDRSRAIAQLYHQIRGGAQSVTSNRHSRPSADPTPPAPLTPRLNQPFINCLDLPIDPTGRDTQTPRDWWHDQGVNDSAIDFFQLGFCPRCPTAMNPTNPDAPMPSATIPIWDRQAQQLQNIRHRLLRPIGAKGDKYRPHQSGLGAHIFNARSLDVYPDGTTRLQKRIALIWEGEKKVMVGSSNQDWLLGFLYPIISATSGVGSWLGQYGETWAALLDAFERVVVMFDPGPAAIRETAELTAALFGRRGCVVETPYKVDDWLRSSPSASQALVGWIEDARPLRAESIWSGWAAAPY